MVEISGSTPATVAATCSARLPMRLISSAWWSRIPVNCRLALLIVVTLDDTPAIASTVLLTASWMSWICALMSPVAFAVCCASVFTSDATTAKPRPEAPARAASIVALSASSEVCEAIASISLTTAPIRSAAAERLRTVASVWPRSAMVRSVASLAAAASAVHCTMRLSRPREASATAPTSRLAWVAASTACAVRCDMSLLRAPRLAVVTRISSPADWKRAGQLVDGAAKALGEETAIGLAQPALGLAALVIDRERVGIDQGLPHGLGGGDAFGDGAAKSLEPTARQRRIAVAAGDQGDGADDGAQRALAPPGRRGGADGGGCQSEKKAARSPGRQHRDRSGEQERQYDPGRQRVLVEIQRPFSATFRCGGQGTGERFESAHIRLPNPFVMMRRTARIVGSAPKICA